MKTWPFWKMTGAGNDFVVGERSDPPLPPERLARLVCARRTGVGADGLLLVGREAEGELAVLFRNPDGSGAGFCGNGARCAALYAVRRGLADWPVRLRLGRVTALAEEEGAEVRIQVARPVLAARFAVDGDGGSVEAALVDAGAPHIVIEVGDLVSADLGEWRARVDAARPPLARDANLTLYAPGSGEVAVRTLERGAGETLACGSAALAVGGLLAGAGGVLRVLPPSGRPLTVRVAPPPGPAWLSGEARVVYRGELLLPEPGAAEG